jgi:hypothetical protein
VRDGAAERPAAGSLRVDMYPLVVSSRLREQVDLLLSDKALTALAKVGAGVVGRS